MHIYGQLYCHGKFRKSPSWALKTSNAHSGCVVWAARPSSDAGSINALQQDQYGDRPALTAVVRQIVVDVKLGLNALQQELSSATDRDQVLMETWSRTHHCHTIITPHTYNQINLPLNISLTSLSHWKNKLALCAFRHGRNWHQSVDTI